MISDITCFNVNAKSFFFKYHNSFASIISIVFTLAFVKGNYICVHFFHYSVGKHITDTVRIKLTQLLALTYIINVRYKQALLTLWVFNNG